MLKWLVGSSVHDIRMATLKCYWINTHIGVVLTHIVYYISMYIFYIYDAVLDVYLTFECFFLSFFFFYSFYILSVIIKSSLNQVDTKVPITPVSCAFTVGFIPIAFVLKTCSSWSHHCLVINCIAIRGEQLIRVRSVQMDNGNAVLDYGLKNAMLDSGSIFSCIEMLSK